MIEPIGLIGIGLLGEALARRLRDAHLAFAGFDLDPEKTAKLAELGGRAAASAKELALGCNPIVLAVFSTEQVEAVVEQDLLPAAEERSERIVLCASTCDPDGLAMLSERVRPHGLRLLETPVSGSSGQVGRGEGVGLIGGDGDLVAQVAPLLRVLFSTFFHIGQIGDAGRAKLAINLILGLNRLALAEGLLFAEGVGLDLTAFLEVARTSACYSQVMDVKGRKMIERHFAPEGRITQHLKDVQLMLDQAARKGMRLPLIEVHADVLASCVRHGEGDLDNCVVIEELRRRTPGGS